MKFVGLSEAIVFGLISYASSVRHQQEMDAKVGKHLIHGQIKRENGYLFPDEPFTMTFYPNHDSVVNGMIFEISSQRNESVEAMIFNDNSRGERSETINFLPVNVGAIFPNLILYSVYHCAVEVVTRKNFKNLRKLLALSLIDNYIEALDSHSFDDLANLKTLNLLDNKIEVLPDKIFQNLHNLKSVAIGGNPISVLNDQHFRNNRKLKSIFLGRNRIKFLSPTMFDELKTLERVNLIQNLCIDRSYGSIDSTEDELNNFSEDLSEFKRDVIVHCS